MSDCAVAKDGTLKDADDLIPLPQTRPLMAGSSASSVTSLNGFFASRPPARKVGGERHSARIRKPSKRTVDPDNAEGTGNAVEDVASGQKCKTGISGASRCVARKIVELESGSEKSSNNGDGSASDNEEPDGNDTDGNSDNGKEDNEDNDTLADAKYDRLKALGDKDREVQYSLCFVNIF